MPNFVETALGDKPVERLDTISINYKGDRYAKIADQWYVWEEECLEPAYQMEDELNEYLEELEEL